MAELAEHLRQMALEVSKIPTIEEMRDDVLIELAATLQNPESMRTVYPRESLPVIRMIIEASKKLDLKSIFTEEV